MNANNLDSAGLKAAREKAMEQVDGARRVFWIFLALTGLCETGFVVAILMNLDWSDPVQRLIVISTGLVYATLGMGVAALGAYNRLWALKIVRAVQLGPESGG